MKFVYWSQFAKMRVNGELRNRDKVLNQRVMLSGFI